MPYVHSATVPVTDQDAAIHFTIGTHLLSADQTAPATGVVKANLEYHFDRDTGVIRANINHANPSTIKAALVIPMISPTGEKLNWISDRKLEIHKPQGTLVIEANVPLRLKPMNRERAFNLVPGFEALPLVADFLPGEAAAIECRLSVIPAS